jgi:ADP-heptose:LPS heptosyltransferase
VESLRNQRGNDVRITWLVRDIFAPVLEVCPTVDRIIRYNRGGGFREIFRVGKALRREKFDLVLDMQGLARSAFWASCARAPRKIGRGDGREFSRFAFRELAAAPAKGFKKSHAVDILLQFLKPLGLKPEICGNVEFSRAQLSPKIREILAPDGGDFPAPILLFPDSRRAEKEWKGFRELTSLLLSKSQGTPIVWVGGGDLAPDASWDAVYTDFFSLMGKTSLIDVLALIARAKFCVTNDSGPMHIAAAMGVPVLGIFGPTSPELYGPFPPASPKNHVICAPGGDLSKLPAEDVFEKLNCVFPL